MICCNIIFKYFISFGVHNRHFANQVLNKLLYHRFSLTQLNFVTTTERVLQPVNIDFSFSILTYGIIFLNALILYEFMASK